MKIFYFITINLIFSQNLMAYLDPFSSSILVQVIAAIVTFIAIFFKKVKLRILELIKFFKLKIPIMLKKTKSESLNFIKKKINFDYLEIPKFIFMSKIELLNNFDHKIETILRNFSDQIIIRSSNLDEDQNNITNAGKYKSFLNIKIEKKIIEYITKRIERSYGKILDFIYKVDQLSLINKKPIDYKSIKKILED